MSVLSRLQQTPTSSTGGVLSRLNKTQSTGTGVLNRLTAPPEPSIGSKIIQGVKDYAQESADVVPAFGEKILHPIDTLKKGAKFIANSVSQNINKAGEGLATMTGNYGMAPTTGAEKIAGAANLITGSVGAALIPVTATFEAAGQIPGAKQVADVVALPFTVTGKAGEWVGGKAIDILPVSQEVKDTLKQPISELTSLAAQIYLGGKITKYVENNFSKLGKKVTKADADAIVENYKHGADAETIKKIETGGFRGGTQSPGMGMVSLTSDPKVARGYIGKDGAVMDVKATAKNIKTYNSMAEYVDALDKAGGNEVVLNAPYDVVKIKNAGYGTKSTLILAKPEVLEVIHPGKGIEVGPAKVETPKVETPTYYHGGEKISKIDLGKSNYNETFFITDDPKYAELYKNKYKENGVINEVKVDPNAKLIDINKATPEQIAEIRKIANGVDTGETVTIQKPDGSTIDVPKKIGVVDSGFGGVSINDVIDGAIRGKSHYAEAPGLVDIYKQLGYDGMISYENGMTGAKNIGIWNPDVISIKETPRTSGEAAPTVKTPEGQLPETTGPSATYRLADENTVTRLANDYNEQFVGLSEAEKLSNREAMKHAIEIADNNYEYSKQMVEGKAVPPANIGPGIMFEEIARKALEMKDEQTYNAALKKSDLAASRSGMELQSYAALENRAIYKDPVSAGKFLRKERLNKLIGNKTVAERLVLLKQEFVEKFIETEKKTRKTRSKQSLAEFIKEIKC